MWRVTVVLALLSFTAGETVVPWWNNAVYYSVLVDSFKDSNGDGLGDLQGAAKQMSYVRALGADAVILSPLSSKSLDCTRPGTLDFGVVDQRYGDTFSVLVEKARKLEIRVIVTLPLQTVSLDSEWFNHSSGRNPEFANWFIWQEGAADEPPSDEIGIDKWIWNDNRNAFWGSSKNEALLNLCSEGVVPALATVQCTWLKRGASGVLLHPDFPRDQSCGFKLLRKLAAEAMNCARSANLETPVILVESSLGAATASKYYADVGANTVISYALTPAARTSAPDLALSLHAALLYTPQDTSPAWLTSSRNVSRIATRYGSEMVDAINVLALMLPGAVIIQQGDELGAADTILEWVASSPESSKCWPIETHPSAAPFPWDDTVSAGFTAGEPWLPLAPNYRYANAKTEFANEHSHAGVVRIAAAMRKSPANGPHVEIKRLGEAIAVLKWGGGGSLLYVANFGQSQTEGQLSKIPGLPAEMTIAASSGGSSFSTGSHLSLEKVIKLNPGETVLLAGPPRHCGGPGPVDKIASKLSEGWQKLNKYFSNI